jgi:hypothetical protein
MQREIEALLNAFILENNRDLRVIQDVLTALAVGAAARKTMIEHIQLAVTRATTGVDGAIAETAIVEQPLNQGPATTGTDAVAQAISRLRAAKPDYLTH